MGYEIIELSDKDEGYIQQTAEMLSAAFPRDSDWGTVEGTLEEIHSIMEEGRVFAAIEEGKVVGWIGGLVEYNGNVWELHPLVVRVDSRLGGVGRALVAPLEDAARAAGATTIMLGTDDQDGRTNLSRVDDLYAEMPDILSDVFSLDLGNPHPVDFYRKCGYTVIGILPDANGYGNPDIFMAKRV